MRLRHGHQSAGRYSKGWDSPLSTDEGYLGLTIYFFKCEKHGGDSTDECPWATEGLLVLHLNEVNVERKSVNPRVYFEVVIGAFLSCYDKQGQDHQLWRAVEFAGAWCLKSEFHHMPACDWLTRPGMSWVGLVEPDRWTGGTHPRGCYTVIDIRLRKRCPLTFLACKRFFYRREMGGVICVRPRNIESFIVPQCENRCLKINTSAVSSSSFSSSTLVNTGLPHLNRC